MSANVWIVRLNNQIIHICSTKENAEIIAKYLNDNQPTTTFIMSGKSPNKIKYEVKEYYTDAYTRKLKEGNSVYRVFMDKAGKGRAEKTGVAPTAFGWASKSITKSISIGPITPQFICIVVAENEEEAMKLADAQRIKTLLDDRWTQVEQECIEHNKPRQHQQDFDWSLKP